ncbi:MAG: hypothetical protein IJ189_11650 [Clostridia bacterium]|nr:hypothetical protein [Clostridia bacterium]
MKHCHPAPPCPPMQPMCGGYLMQRILACGKLHRRPECVFLCPDQLPRDARPPFTVTDAALCGQPHWEELPCRCRGSIALLVNIPVTLRIRDGCGRQFTVDTTLEAELTLRSCAPEADIWQGQIFVQAAVRPFRGCLPRQGDGRDVAVELIIAGYLLSPCAVPGPDRPNCCPDPRPLYPQPRFDPYGD